MLTVGAALTGLGVAGAGAAHADVEPTALAAHPANIQLSVDVPQIEGPVQLNIPQEFHGLYDSVDSGSYWDS
ncbi:hypothetical protein MPUL_22890 [Mycolicibacterium pulveris]|uniref:MPT63-like domain-containing protein n=1 Tax=Mycolicibacterium pulveris TaxID=36813 RepID=A0A7I7UJT0_MYCPV|nr:hypothetical protein MPUL_22890 [Mycolicibacterium pulveris]